MFKEFHLMAIINKKGEDGVVLQEIPLHKYQDSVLPSEIWATF